VPQLGPTLFDADPPAVPYRGRTTAAETASRSGAWLAVRTWTQRQSALLQLIDAAGPFTDKELATLLKWDLSSVNSIRNSVADRLEFAGYDVIDWGPDEKTGQPKSTRRTKWRIRRRYGAQVRRSIRREVNTMADEPEGTQEPETPATDQADGATADPPAEEATKDGE
jgi:hypothetical protein